MKKLESMNICYVSDESEYSSLFDKSEISSVTSTTPTSSSNSQEFVKNAMQMTIFSKDDDNNSKGLEFSNSDANRYVNCLNSKHWKSYTKEISIYMFKKNVLDLPSVILSNII